MNKKNLEALAQMLGATESEPRSGDDLRCTRDCPRRLGLFCGAVTGGKVVVIGAKVEQRRRIAAKRRAKQ